jgi:hypothetical protein
MNIALIPALSSPACHCQSQLYLILCICATGILAGLSQGMKSLIAQSFTASGWGNKKLPKPLLVKAAGILWDERLENVLNPISRWCSG